MFENYEHGEGRVMRKRGRKKTGPPAATSKPKRKKPNDSIPTRKDMKSPVRRSARKRKSISYSEDTERQFSDAGEEEMDALRGDEPEESNAVEGSILLEQEVVLKSESTSGATSRSQDDVLDQVVAKRGHDEVSSEDTDDAAALEKDHEEARGSSRATSHDTQSVKRPRVKERTGESKQESSTGESSADEEKDMDASTSSPSPDREVQEESAAKQSIDTQTQPEEARTLEMSAEQSAADEVSSDSDKTKETHKPVIRRKRRRW